MNTKTLAFVAGGVSAVLSAMTAALVAGADPGNETLKAIIFVVAVVQAGIAATAAYLQPKA